MERRETDVVSRLIGRCLQEREDAERFFNEVISAGKHTVEVGEETIELSEQERGEFVERFSAEIEPTLWESKRLKH